MKETLRKYWGYDSFRPGQEEIISSVLEGRDTLAILPTGGGKSICFQVPALMKEGICIVVSPLIALMKDQVQNLGRRGIQALAVYSGMTHREIDIALDNAVYGDYKFLYLSPERLRTRLFRARLEKMNVSYLVIDEAHCISQWGYDFRPDYLEIAQVRALLPSDVPVIALTATATPVVAQDIMDKLGFRERRLIQGDFARPNLSYVVRRAEDKMGQLLKICSGISGSGVVYVSKRKNAENLAALLCAHGISAEGYHAGMGRLDRSQIQDRWKNGETRVIVSTNAFGMGIDKPDVRFVCHFDVPDSLEGYFQEAGRAGRDGRRAYAVLLWNSSDIRSLKQKVHTSFPPLDYIRDIYQKVFNFLGYAYEEGAGASVKFSLEDFAKHFKLNTTQAYYAIRYIEMSGYWTLTETLSIPAKIQFTVSRDDLYRIQLGSPEMDSFVKVLLRLYPGLFTEYVPIDIEKIAKSGQYATEAVAGKLVALSRKQLIKYIPAINSPMLNINNERLYDKNLRLPESEYKERLGRRLEHVESIIDYISSEKGCRSEYLLRYFGQEQTSPCGTCDLCIQKNKEL
ncbi:MAG: RecQ family ATP-dependent DNA helicase [Bacteroidales bacterium]|nr:RecQ family ATP-dependent DNA helicase [Candidatus Cacconaster caballi]